MAWGQQRDMVPLAYLGTWPLVVVQHPLVERVPWVPLVELVPWVSLAPLVQVPLQLEPLVPLELGPLVQEPLVQVPLVPLEPLEPELELVQVLEHLLVADREMRPLVQLPWVVQPLVQVELEQPPLVLGQLA
jgi:hypothetical protein